MDKRTFAFSQEALKERKQRMNLMMLTLPILLVVFAFVFASMGGTIDYTVVLLIISIALPIILIEMVIVSKIMIKKLSQVKLEVVNEGIARLGGKHIEHVRFGDIKGLHVVRDSKGKLLLVRVKYGNKVIILSGFENMELLLEILMEHIADKTMITEKQYKIDWNSPFLLLGIMFGTALVLIAIIKTNMDFYKVFNMLFLTAFALYFLLYKPVSKNAGKRFRAFEIIISVLMLLSPAWIVIRMFF